MDGAGDVVGVRGDGTEDMAGVRRCGGVEGTVGVRGHGGAGCMEGVRGLGWSWGHGGCEGTQRELRGMKR